jgi:hypothetical protein
MKYLIILALLLSPVSSYGQSNSAYEQLHAEGATKIGELRKELDSGKIDEITFARRGIVIAQQYMQDETELNAFIRERLALAYALEKGEISRKQFDQAIEEKAAAAEAAMIKRTRQEKEMAAHTMERKRLERELAEAKRVAAEAQRREEATRRAYIENPPMNPVQALLMMNMINRTADRIGHAWDRPQVPVHSPINCHSYASGNGIDTTCY